MYASCKAIVLLQAHRYVIIHVNKQGQYSYPLQNTHHFISLIIKAYGPKFEITVNTHERRSILVL